MIITLASTPCLNSNLTGTFFLSVSILFLSGRIKIIHETLEVAYNTIHAYYSAIISRLASTLYTNMLDILLFINTVVLHVFLVSDIL